MTKSTTTESDMDIELHETLKDLRQGQLNTVASQARTEGWIEGVNKALDSINAVLSSVGEMRTDLATLKEQMRHADPEVTAIAQRLGKIEEWRQSMEKTEMRQWVEKIIAGIGGGGLVALFHRYGG